MMDGQPQLQWKLGTKRPRLLNVEENVIEEKEYVVSIEGSKIDVKEDPNNTSNKRNGPLVIPLLVPENKTALTSVETLESKATQEILQELNSTDTAGASNTDAKKIRIEQSNGNEIGKGKKGPLLLQNISEEVRNAKNDEEKFKFDIAQRANDISVKSEAYSAIPVEEFGAALLRGMGWNGEEATSSKNLKRDLTVRPARLGLGAAPKLQEVKGQKNGAQPANNGSQFQIGNFIYILDDSKFHGKRAIISKVSGVPGLNKIRAIVEKSGEEYDVAKNSISIVKPRELEEKPFRYPKIDPEKNVDKDSSHIEHNSSTKLQPSKESSSSSTRVDKPASEYIPRLVDWMRPGIKVKLVSRKYGENVYLKKGYIVDVIKKGVATLKLENGSFIDSVAEKHLETSLPNVGGCCMVLSGEYKGETATLMQKNNDTAIIQLSESLDIIEINLDWVAGYIISD